VVLYVGLDLCRKRVDYHVLDERGRPVAVDAVPADADGLRLLADRFAAERVEAAIESMNGARFVHDQLELAGWQVEIADAAKVKGLAPLACKTDRIDARVLAELAWRDLVPAVWLPDPAVRGERERARFRMHLVRHRSALKNLSKQGPRYLRWALVEATNHACRHPLYKPRYDATKKRLGKQRGPKVARVELARRLTHAIWHMLTRAQPFAPADATNPLAA
jgi:hypothetical protein